MREPFVLLDNAPDQRRHSGSAGGAESRQLVEQFSDSRTLVLPVEAELPRLYSQADLFLFASLGEGFGLPPLEAMVAGTPVVTSSITSLPEVCGDAAWYVEPTDPERIFEAMRRLLVERELRTELVAKGRARARRFTWRETARQTLIAYQKATEPEDVEAHKLRRSL